MADLDKNLLKKSEENPSDVDFPPVRSTAKTENVAAQVCNMLNIISYSQSVL